MAHRLLNAADKMRHPISWFFFSSSLLLGSLCGACSSAPGGGAPPPAGGGNPARGLAQLNDVSVLFPLATTPADFDAYLTAASPALGGSLLPDPLYESSTPPPTADMAYSTLRVVSLRLDPCFANIGPITDPSSCQAQLRLILQPLQLTDAGATAVDGAVHAFYSLTSDELVALVRAVIALREANGGDRDLGPLAVHPVIRTQGIRGAFAQGLNALVTKYAGTANLTRFTVLRSASILGPTGAGEDRFWNFHGYDVTAGALTPMTIPTLGAATTDVNFNGTTLPLDGIFSPATTSPDDMQILASTTTFGAASPAERERAFAAALRVENPDINSPDTIDCASCHLARPARDLVAAPLGYSAAGDPNAFSPDARFVSPADMATTTTNGGVELNVHAFSYRDGQAMINQRVINESAAIVAYLNATTSPPAGEVTAAGSR